MTPAAKKKAFTQELMALETKYNLHIDSCGCCDGPWILEYRLPTPNGELGRARAEVSCDN